MNNQQLRVPKKLIEVAMPLDAINAACALEKQPFTRNHPRSIHIWWARRPQAAARAVIFGQLVYDPEDLWRHQNPGIEPNKQVRGHWTKSRARLLSLVEELVKWENTSNKQVLERAREEIRKAWRITCELNKDHPEADALFNPDNMPGLHDPFAGGGAIPLEAQRLGLEALASDLNPVPVLINKAMIEIPPLFANKPPVHPDVYKERTLVDREYREGEGLAEDVRRYGEWMRNEAEKRIGHLYPNIEITEEMAKHRPDLDQYVGQKLTVIAWLWARTVKSPNPGYSHLDVPLANTFILSRKKGKEAYVQPIVENNGYRFEVKTGTPTPQAKSGTSLGARKGFECLMSSTPIDFAYIRNEGISGRIGDRLMAIVAEGSRGRVYLAPTIEHEDIARSAEPSWVPSAPIHEKALSIRVPLYGMKTHGSLFTPRQLVALTTFSDLVGEVREKILQDARKGKELCEGESLDNGGTGARAYAEAVSVYLALATSRWADMSNRICGWNNTNQNVRALFARQAIPMSWDFAELSPFGPVGPWLSTVKACEASISSLVTDTVGRSWQDNAAASASSPSQSFVCTDPPYYDNIGYADLSDFFYVWLRRSLREVFPSLLATISVPKAEELIAAPHRQGSKQKAEAFFLDGMTEVMQSLVRQMHPSAPATIFYAFKQSETKGDLTNSTGWETFLEAVIRSGFVLTGTWPIRTERSVRSVGLGTNALASSVVLVCRPRSPDAPSISRREFVRKLNAILPKALDDMTRESEGLPSPVAPVDLSQAIIGPGMAVFSNHESVLEADGSSMSVRTALQLINRFLAEDDFDADTQFCLHWFEEHGWENDLFGSADVLARAKATSVSGLSDAGVIQSGGGSVRLLKWTEYPSDWDPNKDFRTPVWEALHHLIRALKQGGESAAGKVLGGVAAKAEAARQLAYRLYTLCERKGWAEDARAYNELITSWSAIESAAPKDSQPELF